MPDTTRSSRSRYRATIVAIAPAALVAALVAHPFLFGRLPNDLAVAEAVTADTTRWGLVHLATAVASGLLIIAFLAIRSHLREAGEERYSALGVPFIVIGSTLFTLLPGMESLFGSRRNHQHRCLEDEEADSDRGHRHHRRLAHQCGSEMRTSAAVGQSRHAGNYRYQMVIYLSYRKGLEPCASRHLSMTSSSTVAMSGSCEPSIAYPKAFPRVVGRSPGARA